MLKERRREQTNGRKTKKQRQKQTKKPQTIYNNFSLVNIINSIWRNYILHINPK